MGSRIGQIMAREILMKKKNIAQNFWCCYPMGITQTFDWVLLPNGHYADFLVLLPNGHYTNF